MANNTNGVIPTILTEDWKKIWDRWNLRGFIILSLSLQTFLILFAPLRKRTRRSWIIMPLWSAYLLADWAANFAVGLISSSQGDRTGKIKNGALMAFWAPFLLVHLGGPDTITAFALEDNELWLRHLLGLIFQCLAAVYVFLQSLPADKLWIPTMLMFFTGVIKYAERTRSLYLASFDSFRDSMLKDPDPGPNYAKLMDEYYSKKESKLPTRIEMIAEPDRVVKAANRAKEGKLEPLEVVQYAYRFFETFKGLVVNLIFSFRERNQSRDFFLKRTPKDAFDVVEVELNFFYEVLYTKLTVVYSNVGYICRPFCLGSVIVALVLFHSLDKNDFEKFDVEITYTLLIGALALDGIAFLMLIFSDWTIVALNRSPDSNPEKILSKILSKLLKIKTRKWFQKSCLALPLGVVARRWSENVASYNLIYYCLHQRSNFRETIYSYLGILAFIDEVVYVKRTPFDEELKVFIFEELKTKSEMADDLETSKEICSSRGDWVLRIEGCSTLLPYIVDVDYDESLLLWHIATELCYNEELEKNKGVLKDNKNRDFSKLLSDYMLYLLVMQPNMMSAVGGIGQIRFRDTCAEANKFFRREKVEQEKGFCFGLKRKGGKGSKAENTKYEKAVDVKQINACKNILDVNTEVKPITVKGDRSKSVLFDGCLLAKELRETEKETKDKDKWVVMSKVWVELMSYAASHIRATSHVQQVSKGGELITVVWLLMAHFGLGDQFQINEGHARAKLIVGK
ncbi:hypothetical protein LguiB_005057 [Lonicera macranthoides]